MCSLSIDSTDRSGFVTELRDSYTVVGTTFFHSPNVTYQISHKQQVRYAEDGGQRIQPRAVEVAHEDHDEVHVDDTHDQDHESSSDLKHSAGKRE